MGGVGPDYPSGGITPSYTEAGVGGPPSATSVVTVAGYGAGNEITVPLTLTMQAISGIFAVTAAVATAAFCALEVETGIGTAVYEEVARLGVGLGAVLEIKAPFLRHRAKRRALPLHALRRGWGHGGRRDREVP